MSSRPHSNASNLQPKPSLEQRWIEGLGGGNPTFQLWQPSTVNVRIRSVHLSTVLYYTPFLFITIIYIKIRGWKWAKIKNFLRIAVRLKSSSRLRIFRLMSYHPRFGLLFIRNDCSAYCSIFQLFIEIKSCGHHRHTFVG